ncbi:MAG: hypothetical protein JSV89_17105 [Spirochaetaceae bacterium]|nr:MAG: hypothetical protein JSV89_17105 [Spirochaetaceae bacterium]
MKRVLIVVSILFLFATGLFAQTYDEFKGYFETFSQEAANSLPITASVGGNWSPAYIGQFPHFGIGISLGGMFLPYESIKPVVDGLGVSVPQELEKYGVPFPVLAADARLGGFILPFDVGVKFGFIPDKAKELFSADVTADYLLVGFDARLRLVEGSGLLPTISAGAGYNFMRGTLGVNDVSSGETIDISVPMNAAGYGGLHQLIITDPDLVFNWDTHTIQAKAQASWNLAILTPHVGFGAAHGFSNAGGGLFSTLAYSGPNDLTTVQQVFDSYGYPIPTVDGIEVSSEANGWSFWVYGGTAFNIFIVKLDLSAMYNFLSGAYGASANVRIQL